MLKIALVEDNPAEAYLLERALRESGLPVTVEVLEDGVVAVETITHNRADYDLVLLDLNLPRLSGLEVLATLRRNDECQALPVIVMSGSSDPSDIDRSYRYGANSYVCKTSHVEDIFVTVNQLVAYWSSCVKLPPTHSASIAKARSGRTASD